MKNRTYLAGKAMTLSLLLALGSASVSTQGAGVGFSGGTGTEADPWMISTPQELSSLSDYTGNSGAGKYFALAGNITFSESDFLSGGDFYNEGKLWPPIGTSEENSFQGNLDGRNFSIQGLRISRGDDSYTGLFGCLSAGTIQNLTIEYATEVQGGKNAGGLAGWAENITLTQCQVKGDIIGAGNVGGLLGNTTETVHLKACHVEGRFNIFSSTSYPESVGGLVGKNKGPLYASGCTAQVVVNGYNAEAGGMVGYVSSDAFFEGCSVSGEITSRYEAGGLIGADNSNLGYIYGLTEIKGCTVSATVSAKAPANYGDAFAGGLIGLIENRNINISQCEVEGSMSAAAPIGQVGAGGLIGTAFGSAVSIMQSQSRATLSASNTGASWPGYDDASVGGLAGKITSRGNSVVDIQCCQTSGEITMLSPSHSYSGGLVGLLSVVNNDPVGKIVSCSSSAVIKVSHVGSAAYNTCLGGLVGSIQNASVTDCFATGDLEANSAASPVKAGGLIGATTAVTVKRVHAQGKITITGSAESTVGGVIGKGDTQSTLGESVALNHVLTGSNVPDKTIVERVAAYETGLTSNYARSSMEKWLGTTPLTIFDDPNGMDGAGKSDSELSSQALYEALGWNFNVTWKMSEEGYPTLTYKTAEPPVITRAPQTLVLGMGENATFSVEATGEALAYQWFFNDSPIEGATESTFKLSGTVGANAGLYTVSVSNGAGSLTSPAAGLWLNQIRLSEDNEAAVEVYGPQGASFDLWHTGDLNTQAWLLLRTSTVTTSPCVVVDSDSPQSKKRFYKVSVTQ